MKTKLCEACRAHGYLPGSICRVCKGRQKTSQCDECLEDDDCEECNGWRLVPQDELDTYSETCPQCDGVGEMLCKCCLGGGVVQEDGSPLPRLTAKKRPIPV